MSSKRNGPQEPGERHGLQWGWVSAKVPCGEWRAQACVEVGSDSKQVFFSDTGSKRWSHETAIVWQDCWLGMRHLVSAFWHIGSELLPVPQGFDFYWQDEMRDHGINIHRQRGKCVGSESFLSLAHVLLWCFASLPRQGCFITSIPNSSSGFNLKLNTGWPPSSRYEFILK